MFGFKNQFYWNSGEIDSINSMIVFERVIWNTILEIKINKNLTNNWEKYNHNELTELDDK